MPSDKTSRTTRTKGIAESRLRAVEGQRRRRADPIALLTKDAVRAAIESCICPVCGRGPFKMLPMHTNQAHGIDKRELRKMAGLSSNQPITSEAFRLAQSARMKERDLSKEVLSEMGKRRAAMRGVQITEAGRLRLRDNMTAVMNRMTPEERSAKAQARSRLQTPESRRKQGRSLSRTYARKRAGWVQGSEG